MKANPGVVEAEHTVDSSVLWAWCCVKKEPERCWCCSLCAFHHRAERRKRRGAALCIQLPTHPAALTTFAGALRQKRVSSLEVRRGTVPSIPLCQNTLKYKCFKRKHAKSKTLNTKENQVTKINKST